MVKSFKQEWKKLFKHPYIYWILSIFILLVVYSYVSVGIQFQNGFSSFVENSDYSKEDVLLYISTSDRTEPLPALLHILSPSMALTYSLAVVNAFGPMALAFIGAFLFGIEYRYFTIKQLWISGVTKLNFLVGKLLSILTFVLLLIGLSIFVSLIMSFLVPVLFNLPMDLVTTDSVQFNQSLVQISGSILSLLLWGIFAACITVVSKSIVVGIIVGFIYPIIESSILHNFAIGQYFPLFVQKSMLPILFEQTQYGGFVSFYPMPNIYSLNQSLIFTFFYIVLLSLITIITLKRQKIVLA